MSTAESDFYKTLLESTRAIPWSIDWNTKDFSYIGPQIEELLGWPRDSWKTAQDWIDRIHPDYRERTVSYCMAQSETGVDHEADYLALTRDGEFVWIRDVVHVIRENGKTVKLVGFMFDISERKKLEHELIETNRKLEAFSYQDGLTGIGNRRLYEQVLESEWRRARRNRQPISMVVIDIDHFKEYNDHYGHVMGDQCLRQIATALDGVANRSTDFCARYGGEEFVLLLPETDFSAARMIAEKVRSAILELKIPHAKSATAEVVTVSAGVCTLVPEQGETPERLFEIADRALYLAKKNQRNCINHLTREQVAKSVQLGA